MLGKPTSDAPLILNRRGRRCPAVIGARWFPTFAGVILVEATKQIYAKPAPIRAPRRRLVYAPAPHGL